MGSRADPDCVALLAWAAPRLGLRPRGFRRVRRQVCRRIRARAAALGHGDLDDYRAHLQTDEAEWAVLDDLCRVTISRFFRNKRLFETLPELAAATARDEPLRVWTAGCASGEEPYGVALALLDAFPSLEVVATEALPHMLERAESACYQRGTLRELDDDVIDRCFTARGGLLHLDERFRAPVTFLHQDVRREAPQGRFHLVMCRNLAFTYFDEEVQRAVTARFAAHLHLGGALVVGAHETLPDPCDGFAPWPEFAFTYRCTQPRAVPTLSPALDATNIHGSHGA